ncbi:hypothetical protein [Cetobacterium sp.]|uniref:hypothetical protein n=1 Tax=Cetobacterium sp. TaxID=2071632 RepID=UPI003EE579CD
MKKNGIDQLLKDLKTLEKNGKNLNGEHKIPAEVLFNHKFMTKYTNFDSFEEFVEAIPSDEEFENVSDEILQEHISNGTTFSSWDEMLNEANSLYIETQLFKGIKF